MVPQANRFATEDETDWSDDDAIYDAGSRDLSPDIHTNELELFEPLPSHRDGATKSSIEGRESGQHVHHKSKADCSISITRLLWVDGWRYNGCGESMTLVVLKLGFKPESRTAKVTHASLQLRLKSYEREDDDPQLVAWGPFRHPEMWNSVQAHRRTNVTPSVKLGIAAAGQEASMGVEGTREFEWDETLTDYGLSSEQYNKHKKESPNGVLWQIFQNDRLKKGITPEVRVAALFSRPPCANYRVAIRIIADTGKGNEILHQGMRLFNKAGGDKIYWTVTARPGCRDNCHAEGHDIIKEVDLDNLGNLVDQSSSSELSSKWLNKWDRVEMPKAEPKPEAKAMHVIAEQLRVRQNPSVETTSIRPSSPQEVGLPGPEGGDVTQDQMQTRQVSIDADSPVSLATSMAPLEAGTGATGGNIQLQASRNLDSSVDRSRSRDLACCSSRLAALEARVAQAEARIAQQDQHITELQRKLTRAASALLAVS